jgi:adenosylcobinamide kinase / adenosylcobinamide-phosphate guanylyltransferase
MILLTGGVKSGKSNFALDLAKNFGPNKVFIASGVPFDEEMKARIARHKAERDPDFILYEEPIEIYRPLMECSANVYIIDCLTTWMGNLLHYGRDVEKEIDILVKHLTGKEIFITNEVGWGIMPLNEMSRKFIDHLGNLNKKLAEKSDEVYLMVSGLKVRIK